MRSTSSFQIIAKFYSIVDVFRAITTRLTQPTHKALSRQLYVVADDTLTCELLKIIAEPLFTRFTVISDAANFLEHNLNEGDVVILDLMMLGVDSIEVLRKLTANKATTRIVLIGDHEQRVLHCAQKLAANYGLKIEGQFSKPIAIDALSELLARCSGRTERAKGSQKQVGRNPLLYSS